MQHLKRLLPALLLLLLLIPLSPKAAASGATFKVVAYYPSWRPDSQQSKIRYDIVTHVNYAFAIPTADGSLRPLENPGGVKKLIAGAHANGGKVLLAVGGWSDNDALLEPVFASATETAAKRSKLADAILELCTQYGFDGVDLDWEYPRVSGTYRQYEQLLQELSQRLKPQGRLLTAAVISGASAQGVPYTESAAFTDTALSYLDWINIMAYDDDETGGHSTWQLAVSCANYWKNTRGLPAEKLVLGVPFYARPGSVTYSALLSADPGAARSDSIRYQGKQVWYNGPETIATKTGYALDELGGVMIWEITQDTADRDSSLLSVIGETLQTTGFVDVPRSAWFARDVTKARNMGLVNGTGQRKFSPDGQVTWANAVALAARIHMIYHTGQDSLAQGSPWYQVYADYALRQGILSAPLTAEKAGTAITRGDFAVMLAASLPDSALGAVNRVGSIPDVLSRSACGPAVYKLYRAGVFTGLDGAGTFRPAGLLRRSEAATLCVRMLEPEARKTFTLR